MALKISVGQYYHANSPVHVLDPRIKCVCALTFMISTFFVHTASQLTFLCISALFFMGMAKVPVRQVIASIIPIAWLLVFLAIFNVLLTQNGNQLFAWGPFTITDMGAWSAILYPVRILVAILIGALLMLTTTPKELGDAFDAAFSPLSRMGLPGHELAMIFSLMLRFIPTLAHDAAAISDAQASRAGDVAHGSIIARLRTLKSVLVALLASATRHAENLARALDARNYVAGAERTRWHPYTLQIRDGIALLVTCVYIGGLVVLR